MDRRTPPSLADELDRRRDDDHEERDAELGLDEDRDRAKGAREPPPSRTRREERSENGHGADGVDLSPVRASEDRPGLERPDRGRRDPGRPSAPSPEHPRAQERDRDVRRDADRFHREAERLAVQKRAERPENVEEGGWVIAEVAGLVEPAGAERRQALGPRLKGPHVRREALRPDHEEAHDDAQRDHPGHPEARATIGAPGVVAHCQ